MIKRIAFLLAVLWLAPPVHAQSLTKLCFPTGTVSGGRVSCQDVSAANPLPITGVNVSIGSLSISALNAVSVTVTNTTAVPVFVSNPNGFGGNGTVNQGTNPWIVSTPNILNANIVNTPLLVTSPNGFGGSATLSATTLTVQNLAAGSSLNVLDMNSAALLAAVQSSVPTGSNLIGSVNIALLTSSGATSITMSNLLTTANAIKASGGQLLKVYCYNPNASVAYIQLFNVASGSVTPGTTKPLQFYGIPATNAAGYAMSPVGDQFSTAISAIATTTASGGTPPSTGLDCSVSFN